MKDEQCRPMGDNLHEMLNPVFWGKKNKKNITNLSSAELAQRVIKIKRRQFLSLILFAHMHFLLIYHMKCRVFISLKVEKKKYFKVSSAVVKV